MKYFCLFLLTCFALELNAQPATASYKDKRGNIHLLGKIKRTTLETAPYQEWFDQVYNKYRVDEAITEKINTFYSNDVRIKIYLGTWCGDSKREVTRFLKIVDHSKIKMSNIELIGLDNRSDAYKQGPNGEEKGLNIHRVPTFLFYKDDQEIGRIVESPATSLEKDVAQIYAGLAPEPNYKVANYIGKLFKEKTIAEVDTFLTTNTRYFKRKISSEGELNTYGYVLLSAKKLEQAIVAFKLNTLLFPKSANVYDSLGEAYMKAGKYQLATENYLRSCQLNPENESAKQMIQEMIAAKNPG